MRRALLGLIFIPVAYLFGRYIWLPAWVWFHNHLHASFGP